MRKIAILAFITTFFLSLALAAMPAAQAQGGGFLDLGSQEGFSADSGDIAGQFGQSTSNPTDIRLIIARLIKIILTFLGVIFLALTVFGGFKWMTAAGNESQVEEAKKIVIQSVIGLTIILSAYGITYFVFNNIYKAATPTGTRIF
jgi:lysylphosphatidylglycerol synthetase-like protein (DUF2156 family)